MLVKLLKTTRPGALFCFFSLAIVFLIFQLLYLAPYPFTKTGYPLFDFLQSLLFYNKWAAAIFTFALSLLMAMGFNNLISQKGILKFNTILPATLLLIFGSIFSFSPAWLALFIMLFFFNKLLSMYQKERPYALLYDAGLLLGLAVLVYPPTLFFFPLIYVANLSYSVSAWRNYVIPIIGFITPLVMIAAYFYVMDTLPYYLDHYPKQFQWQIPSWKSSIPQLIIGLVLGILFLSSIKELLQWISLKSLRSRKAFVLILSYMLFACFGFFITSAYQQLLLLAFPLAALLGNYLLFARKWWWYETLFTLFLLSVVFFHISKI